MSKRHWLEITEYVSVLSSVCGTVATAVTQQAVYAAAPIAITLGLNLLNRERANQLTRDFSETASTEVSVAVRQEITPLGDAIERLESKSQQFRSSAKQKIAAIKESTRESGEAAIALVHQLLDPIGDKLDDLDLEVQELGREIEQSKVSADSQNAKDQIRRELDPYASRLAKLESVVEQVRKEYGSEAFSQINEQLGRTLNSFSERIAELESSIRELSGLEQRVARVKEASMQAVRETVEPYSSRLEKLEIQSGRYATRIEEIRALVRVGATGTTAISPSGDNAVLENTAGAEVYPPQPPLGKGGQSLELGQVSLDSYYRRLDELESYVARYATTTEEQLVLLKESLERGEGEAKSSLDAALAPIVMRLEKLEQSRITSVPTPPSVSAHIGGESAPIETDKTAGEPGESGEPEQLLAEPLLKEESEPEIESSSGSSLPPPVPSRYRKETITPIEPAAPPPSETSELPETPASNTEPSGNPLKSNLSSNRDRVIGEIESSIGEAVHEIQGRFGNLFKGKTRQEEGALGDIRAWRAVRTIAGHADAVTCARLSPDGKRVASGDRDNAIKIWQLDTGAEMFTLSGQEWFASANSIAWSPDGRILAGALGENITIWQGSNGEELHTLDLRALVYAIAFIDGQTLASGDASGAVTIWQPFTGDSRQLCEHSSGITSLAISPNRQILASGSEDATIQLWSLVTGEQIRTLAGHSSGICSVAISPDGRILASGSSDKTVKLWQLDTGAEMLTAQGHLGAVKCMAFSPDGDILASGSSDKTIRFWDIATGQEISTLKQHSGDVNSVAFSVEGETLVSGSEDKTVKIWRQD